LLPAFPEGEIGKEGFPTRKKQEKIADI